MKRILINGTQKEEVRVAMVDGSYLYDLDIEIADAKQKKSNIYKGTITHVEKSLEAVFVEYGSERHGFLPFKDINPSINRNEIKKGMELLVQISKEERGNKGAALNNYISLAGRLLVLMPNNPRGGGISRHVDQDERQEMKEVIHQLNIPEQMSIILRTAGLKKTAQELQYELDRLTLVWKEIEQKFSEHKAPCLLYQDNDVLTRTIRDYLRDEIDEIIIDDEDIFKSAKEITKAISPEQLKKIKYYSDAKITLFNRYQIENQIETAFMREVKLSSGAVIVLDHTEAMTAVDINSGQAKKGRNIEETALNINMEAAEEIARQLRIRDMGGLVVIDFIDMHYEQNRHKVENKLKEAVSLDRAKVQLGKISQFGLLEMSRQRIRPSLIDSSLSVCPRCNGQGKIRDIESLALSILRNIEEDALKQNTKQIQASVPIKIATFLLNEKRTAIADIEEDTKVQIIIIPNPYMEVPEYELIRIKNQESADKTPESYDLIPKLKTSKQESKTKSKKIEVALVKNSSLKSKFSFLRFLGIK